VTRHKPVPVQDAGDEIIIGDQYELANGGDHVSRSAVALTSAASWQTHLAVDTAHPVDDEDYLGRLRVDIGHHFLDDGAHDAFLEPRICCRSGPDSLEVRRQ
jgi:hypothetical protein